MRFKFLDDEVFDSQLKSGASVLICPRLTEQDKPREQDMKGICDSCSATIFFCKTSENAKRKLCIDCGSDQLLINFMMEGKIVMNVLKKDRDLVRKHARR